jgi:SAM-dependent methyltransferase
MALQGLARTGLRLADASLLDVGCGRGQEFASFIRWGARSQHMFGVDVSEHRIDEARALGLAQVELIDGTALPFSNASFDLVVQNVVFSSIIEDGSRRALASEMLRVLRPGGWLLWYDAACSGARDKHFRDVPVTEVEALFPGLRWDWRRLTTHLGLLRRIHATFGERGMRDFDLLGLCKTHRLGWGQML